MALFRLVKELCDHLVCASDFRFSFFLVKLASLPPISCRDPRIGSDSVVLYPSTSPPAGSIQLWLVKLVVVEMRMCVM